MGRQRRHLGGHRTWARWIASFLYAASEAVDAGFRLCRAMTALERVMHALKSGMEKRDYAASAGRPSASVSVSRELTAARVAGACTDIGTAAAGHFSQLVEVRAAMRSGCYAGNGLARCFPRRCRYRNPRSPHRLGYVVLGLFKFFGVVERAICPRCSHLQRGNLRRKRQ